MFVPVDDWKINLRLGLTKDKKDLKNSEWVFGVFFCVLGLLCKREGKEEDANPDKGNENITKRRRRERTAGCTEERGRAPSFFMYWYPPGYQYLYIVSDE